MRTYSNCELPCAALQTVSYSKLTREVLQYLVKKAVILSLSLSFSYALAGSQTEPGITTGTPVAVPIPVGVYGVTIANYGQRKNNSLGNESLGVAVPLYLIYSTPYTIFGGRVQLQALAPFIFHDEDHVRKYVNHNEYVGWWLGWNLGEDFYLSIGEGINVPKNQYKSKNYTGFQQNAALTYWPNSQWQTTLNVAYGTGKKGSQDLGAGSSGPSWLNLDFTLLKNSGNYQAGLIAFTSNDLVAPYSTYKKQSQTALGALIGYTYGTSTYQLKVSRDISQQNYRGYDTRIWLQFTYSIDEMLPAGRYVADY